ncbi:unnamed protein product, partial [Closterium sp. Naga37s-1]
MAERFDAGSRFAIEEVEGGRQRRVVLTPGGQGLDAHGDVFLVDHAWSFRLGQAREQARPGGGGWGVGGNVGGERVRANMLVSGKGCSGGGGEGGGRREGEGGTGRGRKGGMHANRRVLLEGEGEEGDDYASRRVEPGGKRAGEPPQAGSADCPSHVRGVFEGGNPHETASHENSQNLESLPKLAARMAALMCVGGEDEGEGEEGEGDGEGEGSGEGKTGDAEKTEDERKGGKSVDEIISRAVRAAVDAQIQERDGQTGSGEAEGGAAREVEGEVAREASGEVEEGVESGVEWLEMDGEGIDDDMLAAMHLHERFPRLVGLSLWGNRLTDAARVASLLSPLTSLRALWLNDNPCAATESSASDLRNALLKSLPNLKLFNRHFTRRYSTWALLFAADVAGPHRATLDDDMAAAEMARLTEVDLSDRGIVELKQEVFSPSLLPALAHINLSQNPLPLSPLAPIDASRASVLLPLASLPSLRSLQLDLEGPFPFDPYDAASTLPRLSSLNGGLLSSFMRGGSWMFPRLPAWQPGTPLVDRVLHAMWRHVCSYKLATETQLDESAVWYIIDEFGSAFRHSDRPNFRCAPFLFLPHASFASAVSYSLVWPAAAVQPGQECTRDYLAGVGEEQQRSAKLSVWFHTPSSAFQQAYEQRMCRFAAAAATHTEATTRLACTESDNKEDTGGGGEAGGATDKPEEADEPEKPEVGKQVYRVFTDLPYVTHNLSRPEFTFVDAPSEADIIWTSTQVDDAFREAAGLKERREKGEREPLVNQFPGEECLVMKHHLAKTVQQAYGNTRPWLQDTYDMESELAALIGCFQQREEAAAAAAGRRVIASYEGREEPQKNEDPDLDNTWILKPWNLARSMDATVSRHLAQIVRLAESGPKVAQKYISRPALFHGRKFDLRLLLLLKRLRPLEAYLSDVFWARIANKAYSQAEDSLSDFETHFTVMNYSGHKYEHVPTHEFVHAFEQEHNVTWQSIDQSVQRMLRELLAAAVTVHPEMQPDDDTCRAIYGVDVMLDDHFQPKLLE